MKSLKTNKLISATKGAMNITAIVVDIALVTALIPVIKTFISSATNLTATETVLLALVSLFIIIALVVSIINQANIGHKGK